MLVAGVDIGNNTTEVALARVEGEQVRFLASGMAATTGIKGTPANVTGVRVALEEAARQAGVKWSEVELVRLNEATPVIADVAMEAVTETVITESTMIGHNPATPGGRGLGVGVTLPVYRLENSRAGERVVVVVPGNVDYEEAARAINAALRRGVDVQGAIVQKDDGVLIANRL
ncbi:MAG: diol dehydratase reactivase subunit alpha, partial [Moorellaceae bacterium]